MQLPLARVIRRRTNRYPRPSLPTIGPSVSGDISTRLLRHVTEPRSTPSFAESKASTSRASGQRLMRQAGRSVDHYREVVPDVAALRIHPGVCELPGVEGAVGRLRRPEQHSGRLVAPGWHAAAHRQGAETPERGWGRNRRCKGHQRSRRQTNRPSMGCPASAASTCTLPSASTPRSVASPKFPVSTMNSSGELSSTRLA